MQIENIVDNFVKELKTSFGEKILGVYLYGSIAKGTAASDSDIDVLVIYSDYVIDRKYW